MYYYSIAMSQQKPSNVGTRLLSSSENEHLFNLVGDRCVTLATAVVQLFSADSPERITWNFRCCGVACFVKDNQQRSYFIRIYNVQEDQLLFEQELYNGFTYKEVRPYLYTIEADEYQSALSFAEDSLEEGYEFKKTIDEKLKARKRLKEEKRKLQQTQSPNTFNQTGCDKHQTPDGQRADFSKKAKGKAGDNRRGIKKKDIVPPTVCQHVVHLGYDNQKDTLLSVQTLEPDRRDTFISLGYGQTQSVYKDDDEFVTIYISEKGGIGEFKKCLNGTGHDKSQQTDKQGKATKKSKSLIVSTTSPASTPQNKIKQNETASNSPAQIVMSLSPQDDTYLPLDEAPPSVGYPLPTIGLASPQKNTSKQKKRIVKSSPAQVAIPLSHQGDPQSPVGTLQPTAKSSPPPPPPSPPPLPSNNFHTPAPPLIPSYPPNPSRLPQNGERGALLEQIRQGAQPLRKVDIGERNPTGNSTGYSLSSIRLGTTRRHAKKIKEEEKLFVESVRGALARAIADSQKHIKLSDDEIDDDELNDDEWDD